MSDLKKVKDDLLQHITIYHHQQNGKAQAASEIVQLIREVFQKYESIEQPKKEVANAN